MGKRWVLTLALVVAIGGSTCARSRDVASGFASPEANAVAASSSSATSVDTRPGKDPLTTSSTSSTVPPVRRATLLFAGDVLPHLPVVRATQRSDGMYDMGALFTSIAPLVSAADVAVCHMEVPISRDNSKISGYPAFSAPVEISAAMSATGFDGCSTASNHSIDRGFSGLTSTLESLDFWNLAHAGTGRTPEEASAPALYDAAGIRVAHLSYTYGTNGIPLPADAPWSVRLMDPTTIVADAQRVRSEGAEVVVVSVHWGTEYRADPDEQQRAVADEITRTGAVDLVVGHHAHVPQPAERINGKWVLFGLGNLVSNQTSGCCRAGVQDGVIATANVVVRGEPGAGVTEVEKITFTPVRVDRADGFRVVPVAEALAGAAPKGTLGDDELFTSLLRTTEVVARTPDPALVLSTQP
jgi:poly-gamma-glutamate synthesis protein (capsule biosynthesis protein)